MQTIAIPMRCSRNGGRFRVLFSREDSNRHYRVQEVRTGSALSTGVGTKSATSSTVLAALPSDSLDWAGWFCPSCDYAKDGQGTFVQCGTCSEFICGGTIRELREGIQTFECICGNSGQISGHIEQYSARPASDGAGNPALSQGGESKQLGSGS